MELKPLSDITTGVMKEERRKEMERREALMLKEKKEELETLVFHELEVSDREGSLAIENTMKMPEGDEREPLKPMEIKKTLSREGERTMTEQKREEGGDIIEGETRSVAEKESCEKTIHALREKQQQESVLRKQRQEFMQQEKDKTDTVLQGERKKQEQVLEAKLEKTRSEKRLIEKKLEEELEGMEEIRRRRREEAKDALVKAQQLKMLEQQQKEEKERLERMARREEQRLKEEQRKLLFERKISEARKKREEKREERELLIANEARRVMEVKKEVHEKEEKMIEELVERKKLRSQELSKQFKVQEEELKRLTIQFAAKMYQKNEEYNVGRIQKMLEREHVDTKQRIAYNEKQYQNFKKFQEDNKELLSLKIREMEATSYIEMDEKRRERLARRQLTSLRALINSAPKRTEDEEIEEIKKSRREEQRLKEEQRKLLFERKISEARKKREEKREERELLIANEARRVMEMKKKVHEKEEKMIEELVERKKLRSQELSKQFKVQEEELKRLTIQFAAKMYQKNEEYNVGRMQKMLERVPKKKNCTKIHVRNTWIPNKELLTTKNSIKISRNFKRITRNF
eukprot:TRINITY_DN8502_c0_g1_i9.p1 TRINITY_DN8502_c0_g1~~TRINITY_DN8502_c0_g1_i9.p1  ORF type:complete len:578 (-),score=237.82 TRINITY_DN8502_c0_g1_i9:644-2377(-)